MDKIKEYLDAITPAEWSAEDYKAGIPSKARSVLDIENWKSESVIFRRGCDILDQRVSDNLLTTFRGRTYKDQVEKTAQKRQLTGALKALFVDNDEEAAFAKFKEGKLLNYAVAAYYMFIYDSSRFMPMRESMNSALEELGYPLLERNYSFENFVTYNNSLRDIQKRIGANRSLLDAHSFVWIVRTRLKGE